MPKYRCPMCRKSAPSTWTWPGITWARPTRSTRVAEDPGTFYAELIKAQVTEFGNKGYEALAEVLKKEAVVVDEG